MRNGLIAALFSLTVSAGMASAATPKGNLVLIGGGSKPAAAMTKFVELAGGPDAAIIVFPTASEAADTPAYYRDLFGKELGCSDVFVAPVHERADALDEVLAARVAAAGGIFFGGGDQRRITSALNGTPVGEAVRDAYERGAVIGGTSAGTACQSPLMITGDGDFTVLTAGNVVLTEGLGLFRGVIVDQHFVARRRANRLLSVVMEHPDLVGVGVDEGTAIWVRPDSTFLVLGDGWVVVFDARRATVQRGAELASGTALGVHGMLTHVLLPGETFDLERHETTASDAAP